MFPYIYYGASSFAVHMKRLKPRSEELRTRHFFNCFTFRIATRHNNIRECAYEHILVQRYYTLLQLQSAAMKLW